ELGGEDQSDLRRAPLELGRAPRILQVVLVTDRWSVLAVRFQEDRVAVLRPRYIDTSETDRVELQHRLRGAACFGEAAQAERRQERERTAQAAHFVYAFFSAAGDAMPFFHCSTKSLRTPFRLVLVASVRSRVLRMSSAISGCVLFRCGMNF